DKRREIIERRRHHEGPAIGDVEVLVCQGDGAGPVGSPGRTGARSSGRRSEVCDNGRTREGRDGGVVGAGDVGPAQRVHAETVVLFQLIEPEAPLPPVHATLVGRAQRAALFRVPKLRGGRRPGRLGAGQLRDDARAARSYCDGLDRKSTRLNSSHVAISYAVFCLKKKTTLVLSID